MTTTGRAARNRIDTADVGQLETAVDVLRALDYRQGGGFSRDAVHVVKTVSLLLHWSAVPAVLRSRLLTVLAELHNLLGWTEFDIGHRTPATPVIPLAHAIRRTRVISWTSHVIRWTSHVIKRTTREISVQSRELSVQSRELRRQRPGSHRN
ncbi:hypothetical protein [Amycolatopsis sp. cmx-11-32]|uniref:hypothetical protein n=1 Tax=Amycolatopsis sp. cmx-11-32 TaxID=2785796 RepID=UPI0039E4215F